MSKTEEKGRWDCGAIYGPTKTTVLFDTPSVYKGFVFHSMIQILPTKDCLSRFSIKITSHFLCTLLFHYSLILVPNS
jgi:hypothetical protein